MYAGKVLGEARAKRKVGGGKARKRGAGEEKSIHGKRASRKVNDKKENVSLESAGGKVCRGGRQEKYKETKEKVSEKK